MCNRGATTALLMLSGFSYAHTAWFEQKPQVLCASQKPWLTVSAPWSEVCLQIDNKQCTVPEGPLNESSLASGCPLAAQTTTPTHTKRTLRWFSFAHLLLHPQSRTTNRFLPSMQLHIRVAITHPVLGMTQALSHSPLPTSSWIPKVMHDNAKTESISMTHPAL